MTAKRKTTAQKTVSETTAKKYRHKSYDWVYTQALKRFDNAKDLEASLAKPKSRRALLARSDAEYLSLMSRRVFRAGLQHKMVDAKWPAFERACFAFNPEALAALSDEGLEDILQAEGIIRHWGKIKSIRTNAVMVCDMALEYGSVGRCLADWSSDDIIGLWVLMKKRGAHLGGHSAARFLRMAGVDTFLLTDDTVAVLISIGVIDKAPTSKAALAEVQAVFNRWSQQSGRPLCEISRMLSYLAG